MGGYFLNFIVYTTAMIGVIFLAVFVYKKTSFIGNTNSKFLNVEDTMTLSPRKRLYVVRAGEERFLIASDTERTTLISKLQSGLEEIEVSQTEPTTNSSVDELPVIIDFKSKKTGGKTAQQVLKNIVHNI